MTGFEYALYLSGFGVAALFLGLILSGFTDEILPSIIGLGICSVCALPLFARLLIGAVFG